MAAGLTPILIGLLTLISLGCIVGGAVALSDQGRIRRRLQSLNAGGSAALRETERTDLWDRIAAWTHGLTIPGQDHDEILSDLHAAGYYGPKAVMAFGALRIVCGLMVAAAMAGWLTASGKWAGFTRILPVFAGGAAAILSKIALKSLASGRARRINAELPFTLDVLLMMLESGVSLDQGFRTFAQSEGRAAPLVQRTVQALVEDIQRGMPYDAALTRWADRLGVTGARELAGVFRQALAHGSEMAATVRRFADEFAEARICAARDSIGEKTVRMTMAMMTFLMPALFVVLAGPAVSTLLHTLKQFKR